MTTPSDSVLPAAHASDKAAPWPTYVTASVAWHAGAGLFAIAVQETVEFSLQMPGNAFLFTVVCAIALHRPAIGGRQRKASTELERPTHPTLVAGRTPSLNRDWT